MLAWFGEDETHVCGTCGAHAYVIPPDAIASFCLACGTVLVDGVPMDSGSLESRAHLVAVRLQA